MKRGVLIVYYRNNTDVMLTVYYDVMCAVDYKPETSMVSTVNVHA